MERFAVSGGPAQSTVMRHSIGEPPPDKLHFEVDRVGLEFVGAEVEMVTEPPEFRRVDVRTMNLYVARWTTAGGFGLSATVAANTEADALAELALSEFETLELIEAVGTMRGERYTRPTIISRESL